MKHKCAGTAIIIGEITIIPLEEVTVYHGRNKGGLSVYVSKGPIGVVIGSRQGKWAIDIHGGQVPVETYIQEIHGLQQVLDSSLPASVQAPSSEG